MMQWKPVGLLTKVYLHQLRVPGYLVTNWLPKGDHGIYNDEDGLLTGNGIKVSDKHMILHGQSYANMMDAKPTTDILGDPEPDKKKNHQFNNPKQIDVNKGPQDTQGYKLQQAKSNLGGSPFSLYKFTDGVGSPDLDPNHPLREKNLPTLEDNKNEMGSDCHAYGWSRKPYQGSRSGLRDFVRFPVKVNPSECKGGHCKLEPRHLTGGTCSGAADHGSPVLCGPQKKLTYLISANTGEGCNVHIDAFHVPHLVSDLNKGLAGK